MNDDDKSETVLDRPAVDVDVSLSRRGPPTTTDLVDDWKETELDRPAVDFDPTRPPPTELSREPDHRRTIAAAAPGSDRRSPIDDAHARPCATPARRAPSRPARVARSPKRDAILYLVIGGAALLTLLLGVGLAVLLTQGGW